jgi:hypothetical protein
LARLAQLNLPGSNDPENQPRMHHRIGRSRVQKLGCGLSRWKVTLPMEAQNASSDQCPAIFRTRPEQTGRVGMIANGVHGVVHLPRVKKKPRAAGPGAGTEKFLLSRTRDRRCTAHS